MSKILGSFTGTIPPGGPTPLDPRSWPTQGRQPSPATTPRPPTGTTVAPTSPSSTAISHGCAKKKFALHPRAINGYGRFGGSRHLDAWDGSSKLKAQKEA